MADRPLSLGILGAARIAPMALVRPARAVAGVSVLGIAARDPSRARAFADKYGIPRVHPSYEALLADPDIEAIYNPLPNSLHCEWTLRALAAGKHVLCEKPLAANADEAERMAAGAAAAGRVLMEAFHWRYHPLAARMKAIIDAGEVGTVRHIEVDFHLPLPIPGDIRYRLDLAGGATMDLGCYTINILRFLAGAEPEIVGAEARLASPGVDRWMRAHFTFPGGATGRITCALFSAVPLRIRARVVGDRGTLSVLNPVAPQFFNRVRLRNDTINRSERLRSEPSYTHQLRAFAAAVRGGAPFPTTAAAGIANMRTIDAVYLAAGLRPRGAT